MTAQPIDADVPTGDLTEYRLGQIERAVSTMAASMQDLVRIEQKHAETREALGRAFDAQKDDRERIRQLELQMVGVQQSRGWVQQYGSIVATALITGVLTQIIPHVLK